MEDTIFDKIIRKEIPANIVYEDADTMAFLDAHPNNVGHTLVVPKRSARNIFDIAPEDFAKLMKVVQKVAIAVKEATNADGINIAMNNEPAAGQVIFHAHVHVIPRFESDGFQLFSKTKDYAEGEAQQVAEKIRAHLKK